MVEVRHITDGEVELFVIRFATAFGRDRSADPEWRERFDTIFDRDRAFAAFDGTDMVGTLATLDLELTVPGGARLPMAGTTSVSVMPTHRRRGVLRDLMAEHLLDVEERREPVAGLWASEAPIYGRFGYGPATFRHHLEMDTKSVSLIESEVGGTALRLLEREEADPLLREAFDTARATTPGFIGRSDGWWRMRVLADHEAWRGGKTSLRFLVAQRDGRATGYAIFRQQAKWDDFIPGGLIEIEDLVVVDPDAHRAIWGFLLGIDLFSRLEWFNLPVDDPLSHAVVDPRRLRRKPVDGLWLRLIDVPLALAARSYSEDGALTIGVMDGGPETSYRLEVGDGMARCEPSPKEPEVSLPLDVLGHLYLGGGDAIAMAGAVRILGEADDVGRLHRMFRGDRAPWCPQVF